MIDKSFNLVHSKEIKNITGYIHSQNTDGSLNICFNLNTINPKPWHLHRYQEDYLEKYYRVEGILKWSVD
jgi:hypothetical protein